MLDLLTCLLLPLAMVQDTEEGPPLAGESWSDFRWRNIGPTSMGGRVTALEVDPTRSSTFYVGSASGGVWKTTNNGTSFTPVFQNEGSSCTGDVAVAPSDPEVVWVGTGEANPRNSVSWGDGVYKSTDGGESWTHMGLKETRHIGRIAIHPQSPDVVFVAAMGRTWGPNPERGLFRTRDGGETWQHVLKVDEHTGAIDVCIDPEKPDILYAATYQRQRDEFDGGDPATRTGPGGGLWRSTDGGDTFQRLADGLPSVNIGRIGLDVWAKDSRVVFAIIETERSGERGASPRSEDRVSLGITGVDGEDGGFLIARVTEGESAAQAGLQVDDVLLRLDEVDINGRADLVEAMKAYQPGTVAEMGYLREGKEEVAEITFLGRLTGGAARSFAGSQGGQVENAQDEQGEDGFETGGVYRSDDRGTTWTRINSLNPRPFYYSQVRVDPRDDQNLYVLGISFHNSTDGGKTFGTRRSRGVHPDNHALWVDPADSDHLMLGNDGGLNVTWDQGRTWDLIDMLPIGQFYNVAVDMRSPYHVYGGLQDNGTWGGPSAERGRGATAEDWVTINGGDGFHAAVDPDDPDIVYAESQNGGITRVNVRTGQNSRVSRPGRNDGGRFNWNTPFFLSPHNPRTLFAAGAVVFRSIDRGDSHEVISPEITRTDRGSATALTQSPRDPNVLYVGTDDGALWGTRDGGRDWVDLVGNLPGVDQPLYVSDLEASHFETGRLYVSLDGHRSNDEAPYVFVSDDYGATFEPLITGLPDVGSVRTVIEDLRNEQLLFAGTEFGCYVSVDQGDHWSRFMSRLPTVAVHDLVIHPRDADLVAGTHGRGVWIADISPLQELGSRVQEGGPYLFGVKPVTRWNRPPGGSGYGARTLVMANPEPGASIYYYLPADLEDEVTLTVRNALGEDVRSLEASNKAGVHRVVWDLREQRGGDRGQGGRGQPQGGGRGQGGFGGRGGGSATVGDYAVVMTIGEETQVKRIRVLPDPADAEQPRISTQQSGFDGNGR